MLARIGVTLYSKYMTVVYGTLFVKISINHFPNITTAMYFPLFAYKDSEVQQLAKD